MKKCPGKIDGEDMLKLSRELLSLVRLGHSSSEILWVLLVPLVGALAL